MPNPGYVRYTAFAIAAVTLVYDFVMGTTTDEATKAHLTNELALALTGGLALYSKLFPSKGA